jgi:hypothetical protein
MSPERFVKGGAERTLNSMICKQHNSGRPPGKVPVAETSSHRFKVQSMSGIGTSGHMR